MEERALDRRPSFDERSRNFPLMALLQPIQVREPRSYTWACNVQLDQGSEGACVGFSWAQELAARPVVVKDVDEQEAKIIYREAQTIDEWPGEAYSGTSVLAGAKTVKKYGFMEEYRWTFTALELASGVSWHGPAVLGIDWYTGMFAPSAHGYIHPTGQVEGGHAILCNGYSIKKQAFKLHNSWGPDWGFFGECLIHLGDMMYLLGEQGEACFPVRRHQGIA